jgi:DNA-directed RNA polymerase specialized sigma24 family protein
MSKMSSKVASNLETPSLCALARQAARGHRACEELLQRCRPIVHAIVLDRVRNPEVAEDLTQEALADLAQALPRLRESAAFNVWLRQITINRCRMWWRRPQPVRPAGGSSAASTLRRPPWQQGSGSVNL